MGLLEIETHAVRAFDSDTRHIGELGPVFEAALAHQLVVTEAHILGTHGFAVGKGCPGVDIETQPGVLRSALHAPGDQAIDGVGLIE
ncbi:hypothetical protein D3C73_1581980 [compost metagenome]